MAKTKNINLLPQEEFATSTFGRILRWGMGTFRIIVIATELIVMAAFLSRFWLDAQNSDLNDSIKVQAAQIQAQANTEKQFRSLQAKLNITQQIEANTKFSGIAEVITSRVPPDITLNGISISDSSTTVRGTAGSETGVAQFLANLKADKDFTKVDLQQIGSSQANASLISFTISIGY